VVVVVVVVVWFRNGVVFVMSTTGEFMGLW